MYKYAISSGLSETTLLKYKLPVVGDITVTRAREFTTHVLYSADVFTNLSTRKRLPRKHRRVKTEIYGFSFIKSRRVMSQ